MTPWTTAPHRRQREVGDEPRGLHDRDAVIVGRSERALIEDDVDDLRMLRDRHERAELKIGRARWVLNYKIPAALDLHVEQLHQKGQVATLRLSLGISRRRR